MSRATPPAVARPQSARAPVGEEPENLAEESHELLGDALIVLVGLHVLAALKHELIDHDHLIRRMLPSLRRKSSSAGPGGG
jgi:cytochrome b561